MIETSGVETGFEKTKSKRYVIGSLCHPCFLNLFVFDGLGFPPDCRLDSAFSSSRQRVTLRYVLALVWATSKESIKTLNCWQCCPLVPSALDASLRMSVFTGLTISDYHGGRASTH